MDSKQNEKLVFRIIMFLSVVVFATVVVLNRKVLPRPSVAPTWAYHLPALNALINGTCTLLLLLSFYFIKKRNIRMHKRINILTFCLSSLFLVSYIMYHYLCDETHYPKDNPVRPYYLAILFSHIVLAALVMPMVLLSFYYGLYNKVEQHRRLVRFTFPIWLYVTITGVVIYLMISPFYQH